MDLTNGEGSHIVLEAVGHMPAYEQAYGIVRPGGIISRVGVPQYEEAPIGFGSLFGKNARLAGGPAPVRAYMEAAIPQVLSGRINPGRVFDRTISLRDVAEGYRAMDERQALKVMVRHTMVTRGSAVSQTAARVARRPPPTDWRTSK